MQQNRPKIPKSVSEKVLKEFRHKCAICGRPEPHLHHIDENPKNNRKENLLPLCPNCHLQDIHDPTSSPDPNKIRLFRRTKDPYILDARFKPLWDRLKYLREPNIDKIASWKWCCNDLLAFVKTLKMGEYYSERIRSVLKNPSSFYIVFRRRNGDELKDADIVQSKELNDDVIEYMASAIEELCVEMLRYQEWELNLEN